MGKKNFAAVLAVSTAFILLFSNSAIGVFSCTDSDSGKNYYTAGYVLTNDPLSSGNISDQCLVQMTGNNYKQTATNCLPSDGSCYVEEVYCNTSSYYGYAYDVASCPNGCQSGACVNASNTTNTSSIPSYATLKGSDGTWCYDSDKPPPGFGGLYSAERKGYCEDNSGTYYDFCAGGVIRDYFCGGSWNGQNWSSINCAHGGYDCISFGYASCSDGACVSSQICPACSSPSAWSACVSNNQTRANYRCDSTTGYQCQSYFESQSCTSGTDITPPVITITAPVNGSTVNSISISGQATDNVGIYSIYWSINNLVNAFTYHYNQTSANLGSSLSWSSSPTVISGYYSVLPDGTVTIGQPVNVTIENGQQYFIRVFANDTSGNIGSSYVIVTVGQSNTIQSNQTNVTTCPVCQSPSSWSACISNNQTRTNYRCSSDTNYQCQSYTESQPCTAVAPTPVPVISPSPPSSGGGGGGGGGMPGVAIPTCKAQGVAICSINEACPEKWLTASDTDRCCSKLCITITFNKTEIEKSVEEIKQPKKTISQTPQASEISTSVAALELAKTNITNPEHINKIEQTEVWIVEVTKYMASFENNTRNRGITYSIGWIFGFAAEQEKRDAEFLESRSKELLDVSNTLKSVADSLEDIAAKNIIYGEIQKLRLQTDKLRQEANQKRENAEGLLSWIKNLL